ncbi:hypothetical protein EWM64_g1501 [Hericium alpestre]|uniref:lytic cellulose monooxygenase (C4-dehydrogenating) n=1 Tax=Hericium alpestre TaxID=135208 RepID=A0A4Z0A7P6_9AGAM|nr:hypothetical protein EWM64_g1501 [Hericium alpestre]
MFKALVIFAVLAAQAAAHYTFPWLVVGGVTTPQWVNVRKTNNYNTQAPVTDVTSPDLRCYDSQTNPIAQTIDVGAGQQLGIMSDSTIYHPGVVNIYMAKAPDGEDISAVTDGGSSITFPAQNLPGVNFTLPTALPSGQYLVRMEAIALHVAPTFGGAQFYLSCGQINVTGGGSGTPGPTVEEPGILINIYDPIPANYTQPGPPVWSG